VVDILTVSSRVGGVCSHTARQGRVNPQSLKEERLPVVIRCTLFVGRSGRAQSSLSKFSVAIVPKPREGEQLATEGESKYGEE